MGKGGRHQEENHMALRPTQLCGERPHQRSEYKDGVKPPRTHLHKDDGAIPPCRWQSQTGCNQLPRWNQLCTDVKEKPPNPKPISPMWFVGFFSSLQITMRNKKGKTGVWNRQRGLRLWSKTNQHTARVLRRKFNFVRLKTYLAESRRIPLRPTESDGLIAPNHNRLHKKSNCNRDSRLFQLLATLTLTKSDFLQWERTRYDDISIRNI